MNRSWETGVQTSWYTWYTQMRATTVKLRNAIFLLQIFSSTSIIWQSILIFRHALVSVLNISKCTILFPNDENVWKIWLTKIRTHTVSVLDLSLQDASPLFLCNSLMHTYYSTCLHVMSMLLL